MARATATPYMLGGSSGRDGKYLCSIDNISVLRVGKPAKLEVAGTIRSVLPTGNKLLILTANPGRLYLVDTPPTGSHIQPNPEALPLGIEPQTGVPDPLASYGDNYYALTQRGAEVLRSDRFIRTLSGKFVAQCVHPNGWAIVEDRSGDAYIHRCNHNGDPICPPVKFGRRKQSLTWSNPVADSIAGYVPDDQGCPWQFKWDGSAPTCMFEDSIGNLLLHRSGSNLFCLPFSGFGRVINVVTSATQVVGLPKQRPLLPTVVSSSNGRELLWIGTNDGILIYDCADLHLSPVHIGSDTTVFMTAIYDSSDGAVIVATSQDRERSHLNAWSTSPPYKLLNVFGSDHYLSKPSSAYRYHTAICGKWLAAWSYFFNSDTLKDNDKSEIFLFEMQ